MLSWRNFLTSLIHQHSLRNETSKELPCLPAESPWSIAFFQLLCSKRYHLVRESCWHIPWNIYGQLFLRLLTQLRHIGHVLSSLLHTSCSPITGVRVSWYTYEIHGRNHWFQILPLSFLRGYATSHYSHAYMCMLDSSLAVSVYFRIGLGRAPRD